MSIKTTYMSSEHHLPQSDDPEKRNFIAHQAYCTVVKYLNIWLKLAIFGWKYLEHALTVGDTALQRMAMIRQTKAKGIHANKPFVNELILPVP